MNLGDEFELIPVPAKTLAALAFLASVALFVWLYGAQHSAAIVLLMAMGAAAGAFLAGFILLAGYVYADAARRGMPAAAWTALSLLIPNGVGFVLYFLLRKPMAYPCPNCRRTVTAGFAFCPACGQAQSS